jgi:2-keto-4-pentenoate hydratase
MTASLDERGVAWGMQTLLARRAAAIADGATSVGWKIGLNAPAIQQHFGLDGPVVGCLLSSTVMHHDEPITVSGWAKPALEVEVAIRVGADGQVAGLAPALELVDLGDFFDEIGQIVATNICHRGVVFGQELSGGELLNGVTDLQVHVTSRPGVVRATGALIEPPATTVNVVRAYLDLHGAALSAGDRIIAGSLITPLSIAPGEGVTVTFGALGSLSAQFT